MAAETTQTLIDHLGTLSYVGIFGASILANVVIPVPEEIVIVAFGYLVGTGRLSPFVLIPLVIGGLLISDAAMFLLAKNKNKFVTGFYEKFFKSWLGERQHWLETHIRKVIFFSRFMIQLRFLGPFIAGQSKTSWKEFIKYDLVALVIYVPLYVSIGWFFSSRIEAISKGVDIIRNIVILAVIVVVVLAMLRLIADVVFRGHTLSFKGKKSERTWFGFIYKKGPKEKKPAEQD